MTDDEAVGGEREMTAGGVPCGGREMMDDGKDAEPVPRMDAVKEVLLTVTGEETYADGHKDTARTYCRGVCEERGGIGEDRAHGIAFRYREEDSSGGVTESVLEFSEGCGSIVRTGMINVKMQFMPNQETGCVYDTPFGAIPMTIFTKLVAVRQIGDNFHARIRYVLTPAGSDPIERAVTVKAEPAPRSMPL